MKRRILLAGAAASVSLGAFPTLSLAQQGDLKIGLLADMSGYTSADTGRGTAIAAQMAIDDFGGHVLGRKVVLLSADDQSKVDVGLTIARKWIDVDGIDAFLGNSISPISIAIKNLLVRKEKIFMTGASASPVFTGAECSPFTFIFGQDTYMLANGVVDALVRKQGMDSWYIIATDYTYGHAIRDDTIKFVTRAGGKVVGTTVHPPNTTDFTSYLLQAQASGAKAIAVASQGTDFGNTFKQANELGMLNGPQRMLAPVTTDGSIEGAGLAAAKGMIISTPFNWNYDNEARAFAKRFAERNNGKPPNAAQASNYSAVTHYLKAVQKAGVASGKPVADAMRGMPVNDFQIKNARIREDGVVMRPVYIARVKSPQESKSRYDFYEFIDKVEAENAWRPLSEGGCGFIKK